jgi:transcriptional regulator with XRE-family HTH domain
MDRENQGTLLKEIGGNILRLRRERGLSQQAFAKTFDTSVKKIRAYENGKDIPLDFILSLCRVYDTSINDMIPISNSGKRRVIISDENTKTAIRYFNKYNKPYRSLALRVMKAILDEFDETKNDEVEIEVDE